MPVGAYVNSVSYPKHVTLHSVGCIKNLANLTRRRRKEVESNVSSGSPFLATFMVFGEKQLRWLEPLLEKMG